MKEIGTIEKKDGVYKILTKIEGFPKKETWEDIIEYLDRVRILIVNEEAMSIYEIRERVKRGEKLSLEGKSCQD